MGAQHCSDDCTELGIILNDSWIGSSGSQQWISELFGTRITGKHLGTSPKRYWYLRSHRIHGAGIYANIWDILMGSMLPYIVYMDPMGMTILKNCELKCVQVPQCVASWVLKHERIWKHWTSISLMRMYTNWQWQYLHLMPSWTKLQHAARQLRQSIARQSKSDRR